VTTPADIFDALAQLPDRTPEQRAADRRSARILRSAQALQGGAPMLTPAEANAIAAEELREVHAALPKSTPRSVRVDLAQRITRLEGSS